MSNAKNVRYAVTYSHTSQVDVFDTYEEAQIAIESVFKESYSGHGGDISEGGERTLFWRDEESSEDDDGARAIASINKRYPGDSAQREDETMIQINVYRSGGLWFGSRWVDGEYDGCDELDCDSDASETQALDHARKMPLATRGERVVSRVEDV